MKDFENWLNQHKENLDEDSFGLFFDSYKCLKYDIIRPAYLLAYQGLMCHIKSVILRSSSIPEGYSVSNWNNIILKKLRDDTSWDRQAFDCIQAIGNKEKKPILSISKEVREKFPFWRQLRNVVAHYKGFELIDAHVIALYSFIEQYIETITIEGGTASLAKEFDDFLNPRITHPNKEIAPLLARISSIVKDDEMENFFNCLCESCRTYRKKDKMQEIFYQIICNRQKNVWSSAVDYINKDEFLFYEYIEKYPDHILLFITEEKRAYQFWKNELSDYRCKLTLLAKLLLAEKIKEEDRSDAIKLFLDKEFKYMNAYYYELKTEYKDVLKDKGYFREFIQLFFNSEYTSTNYQDINYHTDFYIDTISIMPIDKEYVEALISIFSANYYPYTLCDRLKERYKKNEKYREQVEQVCRTENLQLPKKIMPSEN